MPDTGRVGDHVDVAIVGAGLAGTTLALALDWSLGGELEVALVDRRPPAAAAAGARAGDDPRAYSITAASRRLLLRLGVWPRVESEAEPVTSIEITDSALSAGIRPVLMTYDNTLDGGEAGSWIVPGGALERAADAVLQTRAGIRRIMPAACTGLETTAGRARLDFADRGPLSSRLCVAADGRRSQIRALAGIRTIGWDYPQQGIVTILGHARPHEGRAVQHFLPGGPFAILPMRGNVSCVTWSEKRAEADAIMGLDDAGFLAELERRFGGRLGRLTLAGPRRAFPLSLMIARRMVGERVALVGDAGHGVHPIAGQGLNLALRDVAALTDCIDDAARNGTDIGAAVALEPYERWRRFDSAASALAYDGLNRLFSSDAALLRSLREVGLGVLDRIPLAKRLLTQEAAGVTGELPRLLQPS